MDRTLCYLVCLLGVLGTTMCRDTRNSMSIPKLSFSSLQNLLMSSLSDETDDTDYNEQANDSYQDNGYQKRTDDSYNYVRRGIGQCIFNCLKRPGQMNFIQCKSMCH